MLEPPQSLLRLTGKLVNLMPESLFSIFVRGRSIVNEAGMRLSPKAQVFSSIVHKSTPDPRTKTAAELRDAMRFKLSFLEDRSAQVHRIEDHDIDTKDGNVLQVRLYSSLPRGADPRPTLLYFHGGGYVVGDLDTYDGLCRSLAKQADCAVVSVHYRRAPENKYPAAIEDGLTAWHWLQNHGTSYGLDTKRVAVGGDSAGGNLCAVLCQQLAKAGETLPLLQVLIYPLVDATFSCASHREFSEGFLLGEREIKHYMACYLDSPEQAKEERVSPIFNKNLAGLPPAMVITAGFDPLRDEGQAYAEELRKAGVSVAHLCYEDMVHGFVSLSKTFHQSRQAIRDISAALSGAFRHASQTIPE